MVDLLKRERGFPDRVLDWMFGAPDPGSGRRPYTPLAHAGMARDVGQAVVQEARERPLETASASGIPVVSDVADARLAGQSIGKAWRDPSKVNLLDASANVGLAAVPFLGIGALKKPGRSLFDYSRLSEVPNVPQENIPRVPPPPRGYPDYLLKVIEPKNIQRVRGTVEQGLKMGGREWYNTEPLRETFVNELGEAAGNSAHRLYMELVAATSPRSKVPDNVRNASFYFNKMMSGEPTPTPADLPLPQPYGHLAQKLHMQNVGNITKHGGIPPLQNPKPASFAENLRGNQAPVTIDAHNARLLGMTDASGKPVDRPTTSHYGLVEATQQAAAREMGLTPAQWQASAWLGGGEQTGLGSAAEPFLHTFERVVARTADKHGLSKAEVMRRFARGQMPLLGIGPAGAALATALMGGEQQDGGT